MTQPLPSHWEALPPGTDRLVRHVFQSVPPHPTQQVHTQDQEQEQDEGKPHPQHQRSPPWQVHTRTGGKGKHSIGMQRALIARLLQPRALTYLPLPLNPKVASHVYRVLLTLLTMIVRLRSMGMACMALHWVHSLLLEPTHVAHR